MIGAPEITDELKAEFIELILDGKRPDEAAKILDSTAHQFRKHRREASQWYDPEFAEAYEVARNSEESREAFAEGLLDAAVRSAKAGNATLMTKLLATYHPDFEWTKHANFRVSGTIDHVHQLAERYTLEQLEVMREARKGEIEQEKIKLLPPAAA